MAELVNAERPEVVMGRPRRLVQLAKAMAHQFTPARRVAVRARTTSQYRRVVGWNPSADCSGK
jgi:hypothetical protein